ncbi:hypothetical protein AbraIFM66951_004655 [Aspergillus brasiliensis]|uniref:Uncharacterized protein n=1 Tax=Aspergillus brasiliensis TaxID=319629 RepID=A0A9W5YTF9_9EURO|nr:hypothetical protein AbraCBS73388_008582 [Aspergillus brasiliensis]GKZ50958.1 hypothetical protein AbraIFM66951_004655 [Aspergillus brasiliensis]
MLPAPVQNVSAVSTLSLTLCTTGIVHCPSDMESLSPATPDDVDFNSFTKICQSKFLCLHFSRRQFVNKELDKLEVFSRALQNKSLQTVPFDHARHGTVQKDWRVFNLSSDPPPYSQEPVSGQLKQVEPPLYCEESGSEQVVGKRRRDTWSLPPSDDRGKRVLLQSPPPIDSPTEVNTPTTLSPSPAWIRPTHFEHVSSPGYTERKKLALLEDQLRGLSDDLICELLIRAGHGHLLAEPKGVNRDLSCEFEGKVRSAEVEMMEHRLKQYVDETIERRLKSGVLDEFIDRAVSECRDQFYDECKTNQAEFREHVDDGNSEVRNTTLECLNEMKEQAQKYMHEIEEQAQQCMKDIEDQGIEAEMSAERNIAQLKRWFNTPAQSLPESKFSLGHDRGTDARRGSI